MVLHDTTYFHQKLKKNVNISNNGNIFHWIVNKHFYTNKNILFLLKIETVNKFKFYMVGWFPGGAVIVCLNVSLNML